MAYIFIIVMLLSLYVATLLMMGRMKNTRVVNGIFFITIFSLYIIYVVQVLLIQGASSIYFHGVLASANISPFMFSILPLIYFSRGKMQKHLYLLVSLLSVGMILSPVMNAITYAVNEYPFNILSLMDYIAHLLLSLWGVYLVKSNQVCLKKRDCVFSALIIIAVALAMLILNLIFDTTFFGLSLTGRHNIYGNVLVDNSYLSASIYFSGLSVILLAGYVYSSCFAKNKNEQM